MNRSKRIIFSAAAFLFAVLVMLTAAFSMGAAWRERGGAGLTAAAEVCSYEERGEAADISAHIGLSDYGYDRAERVSSPVRVASESDNGGEGSGVMPTWLWILVVVIGVLLVAIVTLIVLILRKTDKADAAEKDTVIIEDIGGNEASDGEEETVTDAVEPEEEGAEEELSAAEEPESEPVSEEEVKSEPVSEEYAAAETVSEEPEYGEEAEEETAAPQEESYEEFVGEEGKRYTYDKSYTARLSQADEELKEFYSRVKHAILSYKGVKSRISWHFETYNVGRNRCIRMQFRGKSLYIYFALDPETVEEKYHVKDLSDKARYADTPAMLKIRRARSASYAVALTAVLMERLGVQKAEEPTADYKLPYKTTRELLEEGLVKIKETGARPAFPEKNVGSAV